MSIFPLKIEHMFYIISLRTAPRCNKKEESLENQEDEKMELYHAGCPHCGHWNDNLYLEETNGTFECEECGEIISFVRFRYADLSETVEENGDLPPVVYGIYRKRSHRKAV